MIVKENAPGIYAIICVGDKDNTTYIGQSSKTMSQRWSNHRTFLNSGKHHNAHLQSAWNKYGENMFIFMALENVYDLELLAEREQYWLDEIGKCRPVYNYGEIARSPSLGRKMPEDIKQILRAQRIGKKLSDEHRKKLSVSHLGHKRSAESIEKQSRTLRGHPTSEETRLKLSRALTGQKRPECMKIRFSETHRRPYPSIINTTTLEIIPPGVGVKKMCKEHGLTHSGIGYVINKKCIHHGDWVLYDEACLM